MIRILDHKMLQKLIGETYLTTRAIQVKRKRVRKIVLMLKCKSRKKLCG